MDDFYDLVFLKFIFRNILIISEVFEVLRGKGKTKFAPIEVVLLIHRYLIFVLDVREFTPKVLLFNFRACILQEDSPLTKDRELSVRTRYHYPLEESAR